MLLMLSGCGDIVVIDWEIKDGVLYVGGTSDISYSNYPWQDQSDDFTELVIKDGVTGIGGGAFENCGKLKVVTIPSSVTYIGSKAFAGCDSLEKVYMPQKQDDPISIVSDAFDDSSVIIWQDVSEDVAADQQDTIQSGGTETTAPINGNKEQANTVTVPTASEYSTTWEHRGTTLQITGKGSMDIFEIVEGTYLYNTPWKMQELEVKKVIIGESVTHITEGAFFRLFDLEEIEIPSSIVYIGKAAFEDCMNLTDITLNEGLVYIDDYAFALTGLETVIIPSTVTYIGEYAFDCCFDLKHVIIENKEGNVTVGEFAFPDDCRVTYTG